jgi:hypothetical protein
MLVDVATAWQRADAEQRLRVQNFLFQGGVAYHRNQKFLNTTNPSLFPTTKRAGALRKNGWRPRQDNFKPFECNEEPGLWRMWYVS